jgi:hypothetical protein
MLAVLMDIEKICQSLYSMDEPDTVVNVRSEARSMSSHWESSCSSGAVASSKFPSGPDSPDMERVDYLFHDTRGKYCHGKSRNGH